MRKQNDDIIEFIFENINLPINHDLNHGFVAFKIKTNSLLQIGDELINKAEIFFDFNFPIITEEAVSVFSVLNASEDITQDKPLAIYPNPSNLSIFIVHGNQIDSIQIYNCSGQLIETILRHSNIDFHKIDISHLANGPYIIKALGKDEINIAKIFVSH